MGGARHERREASEGTPAVSQALHTQAQEIGIGGVFRDGSNRVVVSPDVHLGLAEGLVEPDAPQVASRSLFRCRRRRRGHDALGEVDVPALSLDDPQWKLGNGAPALHQEVRVILAGLHDRVRGGAPGEQDSSAGLGGRPGMSSMLASHLHAIFGRKSRRDLYELIPKRTLS